MVLEVKCFQDPDAETNDLYVAIGQYLVYRSLLVERNLPYLLYLAVPTHAYTGVFQRMGIGAVQENHIKMVVVDIEQEVIERWID
jgi:hypothetical protein